MAQYYFVNYWERCYNKSPIISPNIYRAHMSAIIHLFTFFSFSSPSVLLSRIGDASKPPPRQAAPHCELLRVGPLRTVASSPTARGRSPPRPPPCAMPLAIAASTAPHCILHRAPARCSAPAAPHHSAVRADGRWLGPAPSQVARAPQRGLHILLERESGGLDLVSPAAT